ncbi:geranyllinalool synthase [Sarracenia purpurea var. burkii]
MLLKENYDHHRRHHFPRWFAIVFPGMVEIARVAGLEVVFTKSLEAVISSISSQRQQILEMEELVDKYHYPPLLSYLEALPSSYVIGHEDLVVNLSADGSLFQSPSATASLFLATGNQKCMDYLVSLVRRCSYGVPSMYPIDADLIRLCIVNQIQRLGLAEHFTQEIEEILESIYQTYKNQVLQATKVNYVVPGKMHKDSLAFRLLRMQGSSCLRNDNLIQLAAENYNFRQSFYQKELEELTRWSKEWGLTEMGFGREKTTYCYYAIASSTSLPHDSLVRMIVAKSAILVTVADDFFDVKGSLHDLQILTQAVQRWDGKGLSGHGKIIFRALDSLVNYIAMKHLHQQGTDVTENLRDMWSKAFCSWLVESTWSETGYVPTLDEYLQTGIISIAIHVMALPALCFLNPNLHPNCELKPDHYETITTLLMASARLLNDIQSYQKEVEVGKKNYITLHSKVDPEAGIENSIAYVKEKLEEMKQELLELALTHGYKEMPKPCKHFLLSILRVFHMFFHSTNLFDSTADLLQDINKAIYVPV